MPIEVRILDTTRKCTNSRSRQDCNNFDTENTFNFQSPFLPTFCSVPNLPMKPQTPTVLQLKNTVLLSRNTALQSRNTVPPPSQSTPTVPLLHPTKNPLLLTRLPLTLHPPTRPQHLPMMPPLIHTDPPLPIHYRPMLLPTKHHLVV